MERRAFAVAGAVLVLLALVSLPAAAADKAVGSPFYGGKLLVAAPTLTDPNFTETVVFMIDHDASGAFGLIVNRIYGSGPIDALLEGFGIVGVERTDEVSLHFGGPVDRARAFVLHSPDYSGPETRQVTDDVALTNRPEVLEAMGRGEECLKHRFHFVLPGLCLFFVDDAAADGAGPGEDVFQGIALTAANGSPQGRQVL